MNLKALWIAGASLLAAADLAACAAGSLNPIEVRDATTGSGGTGGGPIFETTTSAGGAPPSVPCPEARKLVYTVVYEAGQDVLYTFDPATLAFGKIGPMNCPEHTSTTLTAPTAMTIDHRGTAWVLFDDLALFRVDTTTAHCEKTSFQPGGLGVNGAGLAFVADSPGSDAEVLYLAAEPSGKAKELLQIDVQTLKATPIADFDVDLEPKMAGGPQLTGNGEGRLFSVWGGNPMVAEVDRASAHVLWAKPLAAAVYKGFAPFFWGGALWVFGDAPGVSGSTIHRYDLSTGETTTVGPEAGTGFLVLASGVSTCAPLKPPS